MARHKAFDRVAVLDRAMEVFWTHGYEATSVQDLVNSMGINRGSLYDTFGDKRRLFLEALDRYEEAFNTKILGTLVDSGSPRKAIEQVFEIVTRECACDSGRRGCLLTNTAVELCAQDNVTAARVRANFSRIESAFEQALRAARDKGEIRASHETKALARFLTSSLQGLRVMSKAWPSGAVLRDVARVTLSVLN